MLKRIPPFFRNKYNLIIILFIIWMMFFDQHNFISQYSLRKAYRDMVREKEYLYMEIRRDSTDLHHLQSSIENLEKFAREKYFMKKDNEDIFVIQKKK